MVVGFSVQSDQPDQFCQTVGHPPSKLLVSRSSAAIDDVHILSSIIKAAVEVHWSKAFVFFIISTMSGTGANASPAPTNEWKVVPPMFLLGQRRAPFSSPHGDRFGTYTAANPVEAVTLSFHFFSGNGFMTLSSAVIEIRE